MSAKPGPSSDALGSYRHVASSHSKPVGVSSVGSGGKVAQAMTHQDLNSSLRSRLSDLRQENSHLVTQSHRLISEVEDTSHQLLSANSTISELRQELDKEKTEPARGRVSVLEAQVNSMHDSLSKGVDARVKLERLATQQSREREEWAAKQSSLHDQLRDVQEECSRLREACSLAEERASAATSPSPPSPSPPSPSPPSLSHSLHSWTSPLSKSNKLSSNHTHHSNDRAPLANSTLLPPHHPHHSPPSLSGSTTSLRSTQSARDYVFPSASFASASSSSSRHLSSAGYGSYLRGWGGGGGAKTGGHRPSTAGGRLPGASCSSSFSLELERGRAKIRQLEKQVSLLEEQLSDKTRAGQSHVAELMRLRSELSQQRSLAAEAERGAREEAAGEVAKARTVHSKQSRELQAQLAELRQERGRSEHEAAQLRGQLKASRSEVTTLSGRVSELSREAVMQRSSHGAAMGSLRTEIDAGTARVAQLERALSGCRSELAGHVTRVGEASLAHRSQVEALEKKARDLTSQISTVQQQLSESRQLSSARQREATELKAELDHRKTAWHHTEHELKQSLQHSEVIRQSLLQQLDRANKELDTSCSRLAEQQAAIAELRHNSVASEELRKRKVELDGRCKQLEKELSKAVEDRKRSMLEVEHLQKRLSESERRSIELASESSEEAAGEREKWETKLGRMEGERAAVCRELEQTKGELKEAQERGKVKQSELDATLDHMQQELGKRAQQVLEMDALLRSHQADTTARRLQLERNLTQRQADLRSRTQELEEVTARHQEDKKIIEELRSHLGHVRSEERSSNLERKKQLKARGSELSELQLRLKEAEAVGVAKTKEAECLQRRLGEVVRAERELRGEMVEVGRQVEHLQQDNDSLREQHLNQVQRLQESHSTLLAGREQQATSHRLQVQQLVKQERGRQEELSRCRAQVASLSAELAAERMVGEEGRQLVALARTEAARYQAQVSSLQRSASPSNNATLLAKLPNDYRFVTTLSAHTAPITTLPAHTAAVSTLPAHMTPITILPPSQHVSMETSPAKSVLDSESDVEFARLPPSIPLTPSTPFTHHRSQANKGGIIDM